MTSNTDQKFYSLVRLALHKRWDPIGVCSYSEEMGEYDAYLPHLYKLLKEGGSEEQVFNFLWNVETNSMGLSGDEQTTREFSKWIVDFNFYSIVRSSLHKRWDPIGVCSYSEEMGEYDAYLPHLYKLLKEGGSEEQVFNFLWNVETNSMGLSGDEQTTREFSKWLIDFNRK